MQIAIASDHAGFEQKEQLAAHLATAGHHVKNLGPDDNSRVDYPDFAAQVAKLVAAGVCERGVLVCGTGIGMAIAANKIVGIRAANVTSPEFAALAREHNDANVIALSGRFVSLLINQQILDTFIRTDFAGGRHGDRLVKINALEHV